MVHEIVSFIIFDDMICVRNEVIKTPALRGF